MAEEKKERWLNFLALTSVILAVCATLSTFRGSSFSTRSVLSQTRASNQWAYYQAKSVKANLYDIQKQQFELDLATLPANSSRASVEAFKAKIDDYGKRLERYQGEMAQIEKDARDFEEIRDHSLEHSQAFGLAVIFLQIAILLSSISALMRKKPLWYLGMATGSVGIVYFLNGFWLFI
jgi:hypothetical protein